MKIHHLFHVSLLEPVATDHLPGQIQPPPPPVIADDEEEYEVEEILDSRLRGCGQNRKLEYLFRWLGYDHPTWEPENHLDHAPVIVQRFHSANPEKPALKILASYD